jgi:hypothetical protein
LWSRERGIGIEEKILIRNLRGFSLIESDPQKIVRTNSRLPWANEFGCTQFLIFGFWIEGSKPLLSKIRIPFFSDRVPK